MPTYSYVCDACKREFEKEQRISDAPIKKCPGCGKQKARRMISSGNFILKGGGWYSDGYGSSRTASSKGSSSSKESSSSSSSKDSTPSASPSPAPDSKPSKPASTSSD
jgi:putative FmdB family regulatory protein